MNKRLVLTIVVVLGCAGFLNAQVDFIKVKSSEEMEEVWKKASEKNLNVFVDIYASWCGPCKWLDANVFSTVEAGEYLNSGFVCVKMDGESTYGSVFARENGLQAYPSLFVFNSEKKLMNMLVGAMQWAELEDAIQNTKEFYPVLSVYDNKYKTNLLVAEEYPSYVKALRKMNKDAHAARVVERYKEQFMNGGDLAERDIDVLAFYIDPGSEDWKMLTSDISKLKSVLGDDLIEFIEQAHDKSILLSVEAYGFNIAEEFIAILPELTTGTELNATLMGTRSHVYYYHYSQDLDGLIAYIDSTYADQKNGDHEWLFHAAADAVFLDPSNQKMTVKGLEWFKICLDLEENYDYYFHLGLCQYFSYDAEGALVSFKKAGEFASTDQERETIQGVISEIEAE